MDYAIGSVLTYVFTLEKLGDAKENVGDLSWLELFAMTDQPENVGQCLDARPSVELRLTEASAVLQCGRAVQPLKPIHSARTCDMKTCNTYTLRTTHDTLMMRGAECDWRYARQPSHTFLVVLFLTEVEHCVGGQWRKHSMNA